MTPTVDEKWGEVLVSCGKGETDLTTETQRHREEERKRAKDGLNHRDKEAQRRRRQKAQNALGSVVNALFWVFIFLLDFSVSLCLCG
jgi:hypothetical protein